MHALHSVDASRLVFCKKDHSPCEVEEFVFGYVKVTVVNYSELHVLSPAVELLRRCVRLGLYKTFSFDCEVK